MSASNQVQRLSARVTGRVQGVGFRQFVATRARGLGLTGWVKNDPGGSVTVVAEGPRKTLDDFLDHLRTGPSLARVEDVSADWEEEPSGAFQGFSVRF